MMTTWYKIDDPENPPPKDGTDVLLCGHWEGEINGRETHLSVNVGFWPPHHRGHSDRSANGKMWIVSGTDAYAAWIEPTHWSPITPPETEE